jgi:FPC/CPF motif-containing protein YcgG
MPLPGTDEAHPLAIALEALLRHPAFPCVGAKSALVRGNLRMMVARDFTSGWDDMRIYPTLLAFVTGHKREPGIFRSFAVLFEGPTTLSEVEFERYLWARLQSLSDKDAWLGIPYNDRVRAHPEDREFSLSFGGEAFFVVGLHPNASRKARRFQVPALVFNLHQQFEQLRAEGRYENLRDRIRKRDVHYSGSINPMMANYGQSSEARQYSGRAVEDGWVCPFRPRASVPRAP